VLTLGADRSQGLDDLLWAASAARDDSWQRRVSEFAPERQIFMNELRRSALLGNSFGDEEGENVVLEKIDCDDGLRLAITSATYGQIVRTSDSLINEFAPSHTSPAVRLSGGVRARSAFAARRC
jgi:hypothetical protein